MVVKTYEEILQDETKYIIVDVRCLREFEKETIPNAINIPIFNDEEYETLGTVYRNVGKREAVLKGIEFVQPKLKQLYLDFYNVYQQGKSIVVFCKRGGMRSSSVANYISNFSLPIVKLEGGYKSYRRHVLQQLPELFNSKTYTVIYGNTGTGKTKILYELQKRGKCILDLEGCANHRGSLLGSVGLSKQHSQKMFESLVFDSLRKSSCEEIYVEGESRRIGYVVMPQYMFDKIIDSKKIVVETSIDNRVEIIKSDYVVGVEKSDIIEGVEKLKKYIPSKTVDEYIRQIENDDFEVVIKDLFENYYDKRYKGVVGEYEKIKFNSIEECVDKIVKK